MSFGFSVGDFLAVGKLIKDISACLQDARGSKTDYQELLRELECLLQALQHLDKLQSSGPSSTNLDSIKYAALSCRRPLEQFLAKIRKYDKSLGVLAKGRIIGSTADKLRWGFGQKEEVSKLQSYLNIHIGTINILLAEHGLEKMALASDKASADQLQVRERLDNTRSLIQKISGCVTAQAFVIQSTQNMVSRLLEMISGEFRTSWRSLGEMVAKLCVSTQQTYAVVCEIRSSLPGPDIRWSYFQAPLIMEDALGYKFPVPSEYDFDLMDAIVKQKFKEGRGSLEVQAGNYEYFNAKNSNDVICKKSPLYPGTAITMAILVVRQTLTDETCPMPNCGSVETAVAPSGCRTCCKCDVQFSPTKRKRKSLADLVAASQAVSDNLESDDHYTGATRPSKRARVTPAEEDATVFKNVRLSEHEPSKDLLDLYPDPGVYLIKDSAPYYPSSLDTPGLKKIRLPKIKDASVYINKIKVWYFDQPDKYLQFLEIIQSSKQEGRLVEDVYQDVKSLLSEAPELLTGFKQFLPHGITETTAETPYLEISGDELIGAQEAHDDISSMTLREPDHLEEFDPGQLKETVCSTQKVHGSQGGPMRSEPSYSSQKRKRKRERG